MITLEVLNHQPLRPEYPVLKDGIHLRWNSAQALSFPWYGYYLFRRKHIGHQNTSCLSRGWIKVNGVNQPFATHAAGALTREYLTCQYGFFVSNENLQLSKQFTYPAGAAGIIMPEVDLDNRRFLHYFLVNKANDISFIIGFKKDGTSFDVKVKLWNNTIHSIPVSGNKGDIKTYHFAEDCITALEFPGSRASIIDICYHDLSENATKGWHIIDGFRYACCLPVADDDYPCPSKPSNFSNAQTLALSRITYGDPAKWLTVAPGETSSYFRQFYELLNKLVEGGPAGLPMYQKFSAPVEADDSSLRMPQQRLLDMVLLGTLDPAVAQMAGLYYVDTSAEKDTAYDYLIVADNTGKVGKFVKDEKISNQDDFFKLLLEEIINGDVDGWICFNRKLKQVEALDEPVGVKAYALPGMVARDEETGLIDNAKARNSAGFTWKTEENEDGMLAPDKAIVYDMWRSDHGKEKPVAEPPEDKYKRITPNPFIIVKPTEEVVQNSETSSQYPPFRMIAFDNRVPDGWYSYKVCGRDLFGRYSKLSKVAAWHQWAPRPSPKPYYYVDPPADREIYPIAVELIDTALPPPPTAIEAYALDPLDNFLVRDAAYTGWFTAMQAMPWYQALSDEQKESLIGLRIRWQWTMYHIRQAPGTTSFNIHYHKAYKLPSGYTDPDTWSDDHLVSNLYNENFTELVMPMNDANGNLLSSNGALVNLNIIKLPAGFNLDNIRKGFEHIMLERAGVKQIFRIDKINTSTRELTLNGNPSLGSAATWSIGLYVRQYEIFLPSLNNTVLKGGVAGINPMSAPPENFVPTRKYPKVYANVSISTVEDKGTKVIEGTVGAPAKIFRVLRQKPAPPPPVPPDSDKIYASPADYYGNSYYTYRWTPQNFLFTHIYRALDESLFTTDYAKRPKNAAAPDLIVDPANNALFPAVADEPAWIPVKRQAVAEELNELNAICRNSNRNAALDAYRRLSNDALRILAGLTHNKKAFQQLTIRPLDPIDAVNANGLGPDNPDGFVIDPSLRKFIDKLPGKAKNRYFYRAAYVDGAQNISDMGFPSLPVYLPDVQSPAVPRVTGIIAGERRISLSWKTDPGISHVLVYRTDDKKNTRDIRLMGDPIAEVLVADDGSSWDDEQVVVGVVYFYILIAVKSIELNSREILIESLLSPVYTSCAFDTSAPLQPVIDSLRWVLVSDSGDVYDLDSGVSPASTAIELLLNDLQPEFKYLVQRKSTNDIIWLNVSEKDGSSSVYIDKQLDPLLNYRYRIMAKKKNGKSSYSEERNLNIP
jgi:hypothetical protein